MKAVLQTISDSLVDGDSVQFRRFGTFEPRARNGALRSNPRTGKPMPIPDRLSVGFVPSATLKGRLNP